jgi:hypothetical protein
MSWLALLIVAGVAAVVLVTVVAIGIAVWLTYRGRGDD